MDEKDIFINGVRTRCFNSETAAVWLGKNKNTIVKKNYKDCLGAVKVGRDLWWPAEAVEARRQHDLTRRDK